MNADAQSIESGLRAALRRAIAGEPVVRPTARTQTRSFIRVRMSVRRTEYGAPVGPTYVETFDDYSTCSTEAARINASQYVRRTGAIVWFYLGETRHECESASCSTRSGTRRSARCL